MSEQQYDPGTDREVRADSGTRREAQSVGPN